MMEPKIIKAYGRPPDDLDPKIMEFVIDLRYRGDYKPSTREIIQRFIVKNDRQGLLKAFNAHIDKFGGEELGRQTKRREMLA